MIMRETFHNEYLFTREKSKQSCYKLFMQKNASLFFKVETTLAEHEGHITVT